MEMKCVRCDRAIAKDRALMAYSRGKQPRFCCEACKNAWHQAQRRAAAKKAQ